MAAFKVLCDLLKDSGWTGALTEAEIASPGTADSFLSATHVKKTCRAHQVTACSLYQLRKAAYVAHIQDVAEENEQSLISGSRNKRQNLHSSTFGSLCFNWNVWFSFTSGLAGSQISNCTKM